MGKAAIFGFCTLLALYCTNAAGHDTYELRDFCVRLTKNNTALIRWFDPMPLRKEKQGYTLYYSKNLDDPLGIWTTVSLGVYPMTTIRDISLGEVYFFKVRVNFWQSDAPGLLSDVHHFKMLNRTKPCYGDAERALNVLRAVATSKSSVEVWWKLQYDPYKVNSIIIFYGTTENTTYFIAVAAKSDSGIRYFVQECSVTVVLEEVPMDPKVTDITADSMVLEWSPPLRLFPKYYKISYDALKDYIDSDGIRQHYALDKTEIVIDHHLTSYELVDLMPYTNYFVNISAVPVDLSYRPAVRVNARTEIGAPGSMQKPTIYGIIHGDNIQVLLPKASEENGPINYYYLVVIPVSDDAESDVPSSMYKTEDLLDNQWFDDEDIDAPYIAAKFSFKIPYAFILGVGVHGGFKNHKLDMHKRYRLFVRAVVVSSQGMLVRDSPYSDYFSVEEKRNYLSHNTHLVTGIPSTF
ncbi:hypothetical protein PPYR_04177 [Photinus pyralis]|uniref:Fibronectin type-III domain-containing protein n=1 Tax=Photinus pyralis TaxID=7054 RepID=A0A5N4AXB5_PHOPY|nr:hypothetical protein PPYR_04177 [Photinus pyralis]